MKTDCEEKCGDSPRIREKECLRTCGFPEFGNKFDFLLDFIRTACVEQCVNSLVKSIGCSLTIGGAKLYIWFAMGAYIATIISYSFEHVVNFITWTRTSRKSAENGSRGEITEQGSPDRQVSDKKFSRSSLVLKKCCNCTVICSRYTILSDCDLMTLFFQKN